MDYDKYFTATKKNYGYIQNLQKHIHRYRKEGDTNKYINYIDIFY